MSTSIVLTYMDEITDFVVLKDYGEGGEATRKYFHVSWGILAVSTLVNMLMAWLGNKKKGKIAICRAVILALLQLNPLVHGLSLWRGVEQNELDTIHPNTMFTAVRIIELLFEVMPETVLQLFVIYHTKDVSGVVQFSILSSIASAAFIMTDNSMMKERGMMVSERRGDVPDVQNLHGFVSHRMYRSADPTLTPTMVLSQVLGLTKLPFKLECSSFMGVTSRVV